MKDILELLESSKRGVSDINLKSTEEQLGAALPKQYKELCKLTNNAQIGEWTLFPIKDPDNLKRTWDDIVRQNHEVKEEVMAHNLIAIGEDGTGDILCFRLKDNIVENEVYIWYHETKEVEELASDLKEFIVSYSELEDDIDEDD